MFGIQAANVRVVDDVCSVVVDVVECCCVLGSPGVSCLIVCCA